MNIEEFWDIVDEVHAASEGDMDAKCELLGDKLSALTPAEVLAFTVHFDDCEDRAYTWELWAAAYIIGGGCSDDMFSDFRATLISMGRETFEEVIADPNTLTELDVDEANGFYEGYQYVAAEVYEETAGELPRRAKPLPAHPSGKQWDEDKVAEVYPWLAKKHRFGT